MMISTLILGFQSILSNRLLQYFRIGYWNFHSKIRQTQGIVIPNKCVSYDISLLDVLSCEPDESYPNENACHNKSHISTLNLHFASEGTLILKVDISHSVI
jgi:hypothetical protein